MTGGRDVVVYRYRYNGKELNEELGLYDYGARWYDPAVGRFSVVDALADHSFQVDKSPYAYAWNNPVALDDPDGNCPHCPAAAAAAVVGGLVGAGIEIWNQRNNDEMDWGAVAKSGVTGAAVAGLTTLGGPAAVTALSVEGGTAVAVTMGVGGGVSGTVEATSQLATEGEVDLGDVAVATVSGALGSGVGGQVGKKVGGAVTKKGVDAANSTFKEATKTSTVKTAQKAARKNLPSNATNAQKAAARKTAKAEAMTSARGQKATSISRAETVGAVSQGVGASTSSNAVSKPAKSWLQSAKDWWYGE